MLKLAIHLKSSSGTVARAMCWLTDASWNSADISGEPANGDIVQLPAQWKTQTSGQGTKPAGYHSCSTS